MMDAHKYKYSYYLPEYGETEDDARHIQSIWDQANPGSIAEECAEDFQRNGSGWEASWPILFVVLHKGYEIGRHHVDREMVPEFWAIHTV